MTKAEERKVLAQIVALIDSTPMDSYIRMAFMNVPDYAERNIADDAGYNPVAERDMWERRAYEKDCQLQKLNAEMGEKLLKLEHENQAMATHLDEKDEEIAKLKHIADSWEKNAHDAGDLYAEMDAENARLELENRKLKAQIVRMRMERMTEDDMATMYDRMECDRND